MATRGLHDFDVAVFGNNETEIALNSPYSLVKALLVPGVLSSQYAWTFYDTNWLTVVLLTIKFVQADVIFWGRTISLFLHSGQSNLHTLKTMLTNWLGVVLASVLFRFVIFPYCVPAKFCDWGFCVFLVFSPVLGMFRMTRLVRGLCQRARVGLADRTRVDPRKRAAVIAAVSEPDAAFFSHEPVRSAYPRLGAEIGEGGFGNVIEGTDGAGQPVAIKRYLFKFSLQEANLADAIWRDLFQGPGSCSLPAELWNRVESAVGAVFTDAAETRLARMHATVMQEIRGLKACSLMGHPGLLKLRSAHKENGDIVVVTPLVGLPWATINRPNQPRRPSDIMVGQPIQMKIRALTHLCEALATLHEHGVVHRDIRYACTCS